MSIQKINFIKDKDILSIQCSKEDKLGSLCQEYAKKLSKDIDSLSFLYEENEINFELNYDKYAKSKNEITILVNDRNKKNINNKITNPNNIYPYNKNDNNIIELHLDKKYFDNIKSKYIIQVIFSYMTEKIKLKTVKLNKSLQNKINIKLINYKIFSGRHKKEENGIVFEYDYFDDLHFEGEYLNGQRNGKGKEYDFYKGKLIFEGEYKNGMKNGKGKEYYLEGKIKFEGEYLNNKRWNGIMYDLNNKDMTYKLENGKGFIKDYKYLNYSYLIYEGEYLNGMKNGKGKIIVDKKLKFEGEFKNDKKWNGIGYGKNNQIIYEIKEGKGIITKFCDLYELDENLYNNIRININDGNLKLEGEYYFGELNGKEKVYDRYGILRLEGEFQNGQLNGPVKEYYNNNQLKFEGEYLYNYKLRGKEYINGRLEFEGDYLFNKKWNGKGYDEKGDIIYELKNGTGKVKIYDGNGNIKFDGEYIDGIINGKGKKYSKGKLIFDGEFLNGKKNGQGEEYHIYGYTIFRGEYLNNKKWNGIGRDDDDGIEFEGEYKNGKRWNGYGHETGCGIAYNRYTYIYKNGEETIQINK